MNRSPSTSPRARARIAGIPVSFHWTSAIIGGFVWYLLATAILPGADGETDGALMLLAVLGTAAFGGSILAHELGHALTARRFGLGVTGISLELLGGSARLERDPWRPRQLLAVAAAGPATSIALGATGLGLSAAFGAVGAPSPLVTLALWLGGANLVLGVFNLLPGLPLDGGRILQALLWWRSGNEARATVNAARAGRVLGYGLMAYGAAGVLGAAPAGLWTLALGWFIQLAARGEQLGAEATLTFSGLTVADVMTSPVDCVQDHRSVGELADELGHGGHSTYPVQAFSGRIVGMITLDHLRLPAGLDATLTSVRERMTPSSHLAWASPDEPLVDVLRRAPVTTAGRILVGAEDSLVGIVTPTDLQRVARVRRTLGQRERHAVPQPTR
ncbi:MAG: site-2 protease family protein [Acidimicrobiia bacterium]